MTNLADLPASLTEDDLDRLVQGAAPEHRQKAHEAAETLRPFMSPAGFAERCTRDDSVGFQRPPHIQLLNEKLTALANGTLLNSVTGEPCQRLMVTMPPQHGKSEMCSKYFPAWLLARHPDWKILLSSYSDDFAATWGGAVRDLIEANPWCGIEVRKDARAADRFLLVGHRGQMGTAGVGGLTTGKGAVVFIIDDPVKNSDEANSPIFREKAWQWYLTTCRTRRVKPYPDSPVIPAQLVIMTRWHEDDLGGRILANETGMWEVINLPALAEEDDPLGRPLNAPLWPAMHPYDELAEAKTLDPYVFSALYQQHPSPKDGGMFAEENFRYWSYSLDGKAYILDDHPPVSIETCHRFQTSDWAISKRTRADYTVISTWDMSKTSPPVLILVDRYRARIETDEHVPAVEAALAKWQPEYMGIEKATYGSALLQRCARRGLKVRPMLADRDKVTRAAPAASMVAQHRVFFPRGVEWVPEWTHECLSFPNGKHDDQVDTLSYAAIEVDRRTFNQHTKTLEVGLTQHEKIWSQIAKDKKARRRHPTLGRW